MKPRDHFRCTLQDTGSPLTAAAALLPDIGVAMQRAPGLRLPRWGAVLHHDRRTVDALRPVPVLGGAWAAHYAQDELTHPPGTYGPPERAGLPPGACMAYSGGPDSFILWRLLGQPRAVYLDVGNAAAGEEQQRIRLTEAAYGGGFTAVPGGPPMPELPTGWIPYRNLRLILACAQFSPDVVLGRIAEWGPDKNPSFFRRTERLLASSRGGRFQAAADLPRVRIHTPAGHLTKTQLVRRYLDEFGGGGAAGRERAVRDLTDLTWSCYGPGPRFCGKCGGCWCRRVAFDGNGIDESGRYEQTPVRGDYYKRLHPADFRPSMVPMYIKRAREMRGTG